jgi:hypothetical protein
VTTRPRKVRGQALSAGSAVRPDGSHNSHCQFSKVEENPIRHTGICRPWLASSACAFHLSVGDTIILGGARCELGSVGSSIVL